MYTNVEVGIASAVFAHFVIVIMCCLPTYCLYTEAVVICNYFDKVSL